MKWSDLSKNQRIAAIAGAAALLLAIVAGAYAVGRAGNDNGGREAETTAAPEATATLEPTSAATPSLIPPVVTEPAAEADAEETFDPEPGPDGVNEGRVFGQLKGIRDESGGGWADLWIDVDTAVFLTGDPALAWLTDAGDAAYYNANYWYARSDGSSITSYRVVASEQPAVWMYTWPDVPAPGFYGPGMDKQITDFGVFYDQIYMNEDQAGFLNRQYWFTIDEGHVTVIEEQPRDAYFEP